MYNVGGMKTVDISDIKELIDQWISTQSTEKQYCDCVTSEQQSAQYEMYDKDGNFFDWLQTKFEE